MTEMIGLCRRDLALMPDLGPALAELGRMTGEAGWLVRALEVDPALVAARVNLGALAAAAGDVQGARLALAGALALAPDEPSAWFNLGIARGRSGDAAIAYRRSLALLPAADAAANLADVLRDGDPMIAAIPAYRLALALAPAEPRLIESLAFCASYDPEATSPEIFRLNRRWAALMAQPAAPAHANPSEPGRRLRVGYLSADLYDHPVGRNLVGLIEHHDRHAIEVCLYDGRESDDPIARRIRACAAHRSVTAGLDDRALAERIRADRIDLLVVLAGHTPFNRLAVAALRPAPVQVAMHDFTSSGLDAFDAVLGDGALMPEGSGESGDEEGFVEPVVRLPSFYLHDPLPEVAIAPRPPLGADGPLRLVSANNPAKLNDRVIDLWGRILARLPGARLVLKYRDRFGDPLVQRRWRERLALSGIGAERLVFHTGDETLEAHLAVIGGCDLALDPFPFNGCTTSYEALWMGVPVVTLAGKRFVGRASAAMLAPLGLADLAVADEVAYLAAVLALAADPARRARLRSELRPRLKASPLLDAKAHAVAVEAVYRRLWRDWCGRQAAAGTKERSLAR